MKQVLFINAGRDSYRIKDILHTMTVGELIAFLEDFDEDAQVYLKPDGGYTYGGITLDSFEEDGDEPVTLS